MATISERIKNVIVNKLDVDESRVVPSASFTTDLEADSLDLVELIMALEEEFSSPGQPLKIADEDAKEFKTVQDVINYISKLGVADK
jgi:acyl carrier protein